MVLDGDRLSRFRPPFPPIDPLLPLINTDFKYFSLVGSLHLILNS